MSTAPLRYYLYVSDSKVDMLLGQLPEKVIRAAAVALKINLGVVSAELSASTTISERRYQRLQLALKALEDSGEPLGPVRGSTRWARERGHFVWRIDTSGGEPHPTLQAQGGFFPGSMKHVIGATWNEPSDEGCPPSGPGQAFRDMLAAARPSLDADPDLMPGIEIPGPYLPTYADDPPMELEFVAIVYARIPYVGRTVLSAIGSPLYVALA
jgi:hypothetical protein